MSYEEDRAELFTARETIARLTIPVTEEAVKRHETWRAKVWHYGSCSIDHFLTKEDVVELLECDNWVEWVKAPDGTPLDKFTLEPVGGGEQS